MALSGLRVEKDGLHGNQTLLEVLDWAFDWAKKWLPGGDTINSSVWEEDSGGDATFSNEVNSAGVTSAFVDLQPSAVLGQSIKITNRITTNNGRTAERSFVLDVVEKKP